MHRLQLQTPLTLDRLNIADLDVSTLGKDHLLDLLALFTRVGEFIIRQSDNLKIWRIRVEDAEKSIADGLSRLFQWIRRRLRCHNLFLGHGIYASFSITASHWQCLLSLSLVITSPSLGTMLLLKELLDSVGSILTTLCIRVVQGLEWWKMDDERRGKSLFTHHLCFH